jgi:hypothetical protein
MNRFLSCLSGHLLLLGVNLALVGCSSSSASPLPDGSTSQPLPAPQWSLDNRKEDKVQCRSARLPLLSLVVKPRRVW